MTKYLIAGSMILFSLLIASGNNEAVKYIEASSPGVLGSILGGLVAGVSIILTTLLALREKIKLDGKRVERFLNSMRRDVQILVACLLLSILIPYFRVSGIPLLHYPEADLIPSRDYIYTAALVFNLLLAFSLITETFRTLIGLFSTLFKVDK